MRPMITVKGEAELKSLDAASLDEPKMELEQAIAHKLPPTWMAGSAKERSLPISSAVLNANNLSNANTSPARSSRNTWSSWMTLTWR